MKLPQILDALIATTCWSLYLFGIPSIFRNNPTFWPSVVSFFGSSDKTSYFIGTHFLHAVLFILLNSMLAVLYWMNNPKVESFKTEKGPWPWRSDKPEDRAKFVKLFWWTIVGVTLNNLLISMPVSYFSYDKVRSDGVFESSFESFPTQSTIIWQLAVCLLVEDFMFYWSHRFLHTPFLFKHIHKIHHMHHNPVGIASEFAHPVEFYLGNMLPFTLGPALVKTHVFTFWLWLGIRLGKTWEAHSGYSFPFSPFQFLPFANPASAHDYHHSRGITSCYGSFLRIWDTSMGTNKAFSALNEKKDE